VKKSIRFSFVKEWIIVHDHRTYNASIRNASSAVFGHAHPKIKECFTSDEGNYGNSERNFGLNLVPEERMGWIYFLDDDNYMHVNMWTLM
jgi:hypothetical protein